jgi:hypothetical protein
MYNEDDNVNERIYGIYDDTENDRLEREQEFDEPEYYEEDYCG